jgi:hypothetical protein
MVLDDGRNRRRRWLTWIADRRRVNRDYSQELLDDGGHR